MVFSEAIYTMRICIKLSVAPLPYMVILAWINNDMTTKVCDEITSKLQQLMFASW